jgi:hypothetical protein
MRMGILVDEQRLLTYRKEGQSWSWIRTPGAGRARQGCRTLLEWAPVPRQCMCRSIMQQNPPRQISIE